MSGMTPGRAVTAAEDWPAIAAHAAHHDIADAAGALTSWRALSEERRVNWRASADAVRMLLDARHADLRAAVAELAARVQASADATRPSKKTQTEDELAAALRQILEES